jgi:hypothetical protein
MKVRIIRATHSQWYQVGEVYEVDDQLSGIDSKGEEWDGMLYPLVSNRNAGIAPEHCEPAPDALTKEVCDVFNAMFKTFPEGWNKATYEKLTCEVSIDENMRRIVRNMQVVRKDREKLFNAFTEQCLEVEEYRQLTKAIAYVLSRAKKDT